MDIDQAERVEAIENLKAAAGVIGYHSTLAGKTEAEIEEAITLCTPFLLCASSTAAEFLWEIVHPVAEHARATALAELGRRALAERQLRDAQARAEAQKRLLIEVASHVQQREQAVSERERTVGPIEEFEKRRCEFEQERARINADFRSREAAFDRAQAEAKRGLDARADALAAEEAKLAGDRWYRFAIKLAAAVIVVFTLAVWSRSALLKPYVEAREEHAGQRQSLSAAWKEISRREGGLAARESDLTKARAELEAGKQALAGDARRLKEREEELRAELWRLENRSGSLEAREREVEETKRRFVSWQEGLDAQQKALDRRTLEQRATLVKAAESKPESRNVEITIANGHPLSLGAEVEINGRLVRINGTGTASVSLPKGRHTYRVRAVTRDFAATVLQWFGSGTIDVDRDGQRFTITGRYPSLRLVSN